MENENESQALPGASGDDQAQEDAKLIPVDEAEHIDQLTETILGINQTAALVGRLAGTLLPKPTEKTSPDTSGGAQGGRRGRLYSYKSTRRPSYPIGRGQMEVHSLTLASRDDFRSRPKFELEKRQKAQEWLAEMRPDGA